MGDWGGGAVWEGTVGVQNDAGRVCCVDGAEGVGEIGLWTDCGG